MWVMERRPFDLRVVFDYYFPNALPDPSNVPSTFQMSKELDERIEKLLDSKADQAEVLRRWSGIRTNKELSGTLVLNSSTISRPVAGSKRETANRPGLSCA